MSGTHHSEGPISHGICLNCKIKLEYPEIPLLTLIDKLSFPVLYTDKEEKLIVANHKAKKLIELKDKERSTQSPGEVIYCVYEGKGVCGNKIHCSGCVILNSVKYTNETGKALRDVKAFHLVKKQGLLSKSPEVRIHTDLKWNSVIFQMDIIDLQLP